MSKWFAGIPDKNSNNISKDISREESSIIFSNYISPDQNPIIFSKNISQSENSKKNSGGGSVLFFRTFCCSFLNQFKFAGRDRRIKKGQSGVDKTRLKRLKRTPLQRWRYKLDKKKYAWPTPINNLPTYEQEIKIGYFKLQVESLLNYFFPHLRSRSRKNPPKTKR